MLVVCWAIGWMSFLLSGSDGIQIANFPCVALLITCGLECGVNGGEGRIAAATNWWTVSADRTDLGELLSHWKFISGSDATSPKNYRSFFHKISGILRASCDPAVL